MLKSELLIPKKLRYISLIRIVFKVEVVVIFVSIGMWDAVRFGTLYFPSVADL